MNWYETLRRRPWFCIEKQLKELSVIDAHSIASSIYIHCFRDDYSRYERFSLCNRLIIDCTMYNVQVMKIGPYTVVNVNHSTLRRW